MLLDSPPDRGAKYIFTITANKRGILFLSDAKKLPGSQKTGSGADRNKLYLPISELYVINPFFVGCVVALEIELDCHV